MKASKRLVKALIALVASIVLCIGVCLAWFATNADVDANGLNNNIKSTNITKFAITVYTLTDKTSVTTDGTTVTTYKVGELKSSTLNGNTGATMASYGGLTGGSVTALLMKFTYEFDDNLNKRYGIYADCKNTRSEIGYEGAGADMRLNCALSSVISFYRIGEADVNVGDTVTQKAEIDSEEVPDTSGNLVALKDGISDSVTQGSVYCIVDYVENKIFTQYYKALSIEGTTLSTPMDFLSDIAFYMGESTSA